MNQEPNHLIKASSPYLLQHAYNPVNWYEWGEEPLEIARRENKLILVSIGYSACHWCHVMERESFEREEVALVMNKHYVCIKVDREERPDIDQIYMLAIQLMTGSGGWPLNCICLPDQRPIYGGTYFQKSDWINILLNVADLWHTDPDKAIAYADRLTKGIRSAETVIPNPQAGEFNRDQLTEIVAPWKTRLDRTKGGYNRAPKFPMPSNWQFMMRYSHLMEDPDTHTATMLTLEKMALGGIYDQIGGGFARYSVDDHWHVPHFEKMLYDNAQLVGLYSEAFQYSNHPLYKRVVLETVDWLSREMTSPEGLFYSALDADSEGVEGKFYVWDKSAFEAVVGEDAQLLSQYFNVTEEGNWAEEQTNILLRSVTDEEFALQAGLTPEELQDKVSNAREKLLSHRSRRIRPGLDDKCITAWNGLTIKGLTDAALVFGNESFQGMAARAAEFILLNLKTGSGGLLRNYKNGKASIPAFLDDYAFVIDALLGLYATDFNERWLLEAKTLTDYVIEHFEDPDGPMFFYTAANGEKLIARKHEVMDNVISSSNSVMAQNLQHLGILFDNDEYSHRAKQMLQAVLPDMKAYGSAYSNWAIQLLSEVFGITEVAIAGDEAQKVAKALNAFYLPNKITLGGTNSNLPLLKGKESIETKIYICRNKVCQLPVRSIEEAINLITKKDYNEC
jgi:uncharacterized protein YyaL (SSP411 family)